MSATLVNAVQRAMREFQLTAECLRERNPAGAANFDHLAKEMATALVDSEKATMLFELCDLCGQTGYVHSFDRFGHRATVACCCKKFHVVSTGVTTRQLESLVKLDKFRQEAGISTEMLREMAEKRKRPS